MPNATLPIMYIYNHCLSTLVHSVISSCCYPDGHVCSMPDIPFRLFVTGGLFPPADPQALIYEYHLEADKWEAKRARLPSMALLQASAIFN